MALRYTCEIDIKKPRNEVTELVINPSNMQHWQPGFLGMESLSGTPGKAGAKSKLRYKMGSREMEMVETIMETKLPEAYSVRYETKSIFNEQVNKFYEIDKDTTRWVSESVFKFNGGMKIMGWLIPGAFKKQSQKYLDQFKAFAEKSV